MYDHKQSMKEVVRHVMFRSGMIEALDVFRNLRGRNTRHMRQGDMAQIFSQIYADKVWVGQQNQDSLSGLGSTARATEQLVDGLSSFLEQVGCRRLVDVGCGDFNWMRRVRGDFEYIGIDTVAELVEANNRNFADGRRKFVCLDATRSPIPSGDVAICREVLFHLSFEAGLHLLRNIKAAGFKYALLTTDRSVWFNSDIRNGDFRLLNLSRAPYTLPEPERVLLDDKVASHRMLGVWNGATLAV